MEAECQSQSHLIGGHFLLLVEIHLSIKKFEK